MVSSGGMGTSVFYTIVVLVLIGVSVFGIIVRKKQAGNVPTASASEKPPIGICIAMMLILFLSVGISGYIFDSVVVLKIASYSLASSYWMQGITNLFYAIACLLLTGFYKKMHFHRGLLLALFMILWSIFIMLDIDQDTLSFNHPAVLAAFILHALGSVFCGLLVLAAAAYRWFYETRYLIIGLLAAVINAANYAGVFLGATGMNFDALLWMGIVACVAAILLCLLLLPGDGHTVLKPMELFEFNHHDGHKKTILVLAAGMVLLCFSAERMRPGLLNFYLQIGSISSSANISVSILILFVGTFAGCILFAPLVGRFKMRRTLMIFLAAGLASFCVGMLSRISFVGYAAFFVLGFGLATPLLIAPAAAMELSGDRYNLRAAGLIGAGYYAGIVLSGLCRVYFGI